MNKDILAPSIAQLFCAFGKADDIARQKIYYSALKHLDAQLVQYAIFKILLKATYLPSLGEIFNEAKSIDQEMNPNQHILPWEEALNEITSAMRQSPHKKIRWSTPELETTIRIIGWHNIIYCDTKNYSYVITTTHKIYTAICKKLEEKSINRAFLQLNGGNFLGTPFRIDSDTYSIRESTMINTLFASCINNAKAKDDF